jgi:hypothetical protein
MLSIKGANAIDKNKRNIQLLNVYSELRRDKNSAT